MKRIAIILARGGSKRLVRKNVLNVHGKPMLAWTVEAAVHSEMFDRVVVSTDDSEIAEIGRAYGAEAPFLRDCAADDMATSSEATLAALRQAEEYWGEQYELVSQLMANCPLRHMGDIKAAIESFLHSGAESQISCFRFGWMNPWWAAKLDAQGRPDYVFPEARTARSQDLPHLYCPSGAIWVARTESLKAQRTFYTADHLLHPMSWMSAMDIDDEEDLQMAKVCFLSREQANQA